MFINYEHENHVYNVTVERRKNHYFIMYDNTEYTVEASEIKPGQLKIKLGDRVIKCVITEGTGGEHSKGSLHYVGLALDFRTRDMTDKMAEVLVMKIKESLGDQYDVVLEKDHIHVEFQPKV